MSWQDAESSYGPLPQPHNSTYQHQLAHASYLTLTYPFQHPPQPVHYPPALVPIAPQPQERENTEPAFSQGAVQKRRRRTRSRRTENVVGRSDLPPPRPRCRHRERMTQADDDLVCYLKEEKNLEWAQISDHFPGRSSGSLQVRYCQRLSKRKNRLNEEEKKRFRQLHKAEEANLWTRLGRAFKMTAEQARVLGRELLNEDEEDPVGESREGLSRQ